MSERPEPSRSSRARSFARRLRPKSVRAKVAALLLVPVVSLLVLGALAAVSTMQDAWSLQQRKDLGANLATPVAALTTRLQAERSAVAPYLSPNDTGDSRVLAERHDQTEAALSALQDGVTRDSGDIATIAPEVSRRLGDVSRDIDGLRADQAVIVARQLDWPTAFDAYNTAIGDTIAVGSALTDVQSGESAKAVEALARIGEMLARQDAVANSTRASGRLTAEEYRAFTDAVGGQQVVATDVVRDLTPDLRAGFQRLVGGDDYASLTALQNTARGDVSGRALAAAVAGGAWRSAMGPVAQSVTTFWTNAAGAAVAETGAAGKSALTKGALVIVLGLVAVLASLVISVRIGRGLVLELVTLRDSALDLALRRLPQAMRRLRAGERVDVDAAVPVVPPGEGEIGQVGDALNAVQRSALQAAAERGELLHGVSGVFVTLARRSQSLVHRQLALLDTMERRTENPADLEDLFRLDHLAARMRRHAEGLIIMSGSAPGRKWSNPVPLLTVIRAAVAEVEHFQRVEVRRMAPVSVRGAAVADLTHLIAELVENATSFSPPTTTVRVRGEGVGSGFVVEIEDRGLGMSPETLAEANQRIAEAHQLDLVDRDQLGLFVVSRLAHRQNIHVTLRPSAYGGTTVVILLPAAILSRPDRPDRPIPAEERPKLLRQPAAVSVPAPSVGPGDPAPPTVVKEPSSDGPATAIVWPSDDATGGLPRRTRQANLAPGLRRSDPRNGKGNGSGNGNGSASPQPNPDQARATMSALQQGFRRGRDG
ncbi:sensor histidine kinase [Amycolatopsis pigmentata]|uniref:histidine kinase n=1 Tax=Amycolatopsis pigmentata TaxID=450801 RepID=A0ABW5G4C5_9PSEU